MNDLSILSDLGLDPELIKFLKENPELAERAAEGLSKPGEEILSSSVDTRLQDEIGRAAVSGAPDSPSKSFIESGPYSRTRKIDTLERMNSPGAAAQARFRLRQDAMAAAQDIQAPADLVSPVDALATGPEALMESKLSALGSDVVGTPGEDGPAELTAVEGTFGTDMAQHEVGEMFGQADLLDGVVTEMGAEAMGTFQPEINIPEPEIDIDLGGGFGGFNAAVGGGLRGFFGM